MESCSDCPKRQSCRALCDAMEAKLPKPWDGRDWLFSEANAQERIERLLENRAMVALLTSMRDVLTRAQRKVFDLYYNEGLNQYEIAERLGMRRTSVDEHLSRSRARILARLQRTDAYAASSSGTTPLRKT